MDWLIEKCSRCHHRWVWQELSDHWECDYEWCWNLRVHSRKQRGLHPSTVIRPHQRSAPSQGLVSLAQLPACVLISLNTCCIPRASGVEGWSPHVSNCHPRWHCYARLPSSWRPQPCPPLASEWKSTAPLLPNASASKRLPGHLQHHCKNTFFISHLRAAILLLGSFKFDDLRHSSSIIYSPLIWLKGIMSDVVGHRTFTELHNKTSLQCSLNNWKS